MSTPEKYIPSTETLSDSPWEVGIGDYLLGSINVSLDLSRNPEQRAEIMRARTELSTRGYTIVDNEKIGFSRTFLEQANALFDDSSVVYNHEGDVPANRRRARDVVRWEGALYPTVAASFELWSNPDTTISDTTYKHTEDKFKLAIEERKRKVSRFHAVENTAFASYIAALLATMPEHLQYNRFPFNATEMQDHQETVSINAFETSGEVVKNIYHHDPNTCFIALTVIDVQGSGAESVLKREDDDEDILRQSIQPGQTLIFANDDFLHGALPLIPLEGQETTRRRAFVLTLDTEGTYPNPLDEDPEDEKDSGDFNDERRKHPTPIGTFAVTASKKV